MATVVPSWHGGDGLFPKEIRGVNGVDLKVSLSLQACHRRRLPTQPQFALWDEGCVGTRHCHSMSQWHCQLKIGRELASPWELQTVCGFPVLFAFQIVIKVTRSKAGSQAQTNRPLLLQCTKRQSNSHLWEPVETAPERNPMCHTMIYLFLQAPIFCCHGTSWGAAGASHKKRGDAGRAAEEFSRHSQQPGAF